MFYIRMQLLGAGRPVTFDGFVDSILAEVVRRVGAEMQNLLQARPVSAEIPLPLVGPMEIDIGPQKRLEWVDDQ
jgi:hypothetical protein